MVTFQIKNPKSEDVDASVFSQIIANFASQRTDFYLYVDESQNFATQSFLKILPIYRADGLTSA